ncbi:heat shock cognate 70 kda protein 1 [Hordeum vulgare]|nr:heat shock cognate 70 kda protein 1 [Hordeum vulgare]
MEGRPHTWLRLPYSFMKEMEEHAPLFSWMQPDDYCSRPSWVVTEFNSINFMFLKHGWKSFALAQGLWEGYVLHFKFDGATTLFKKVFGIVGGHLDCCLESDSSSSKTSPSGTDVSGSSSFGGSRGDSESDGSPGARVKEQSSD